MGNTGEFINNLAPYFKVIWLVTITLQLPSHKEIINFAELSCT